MSHQPQGQGQGQGDLTEDQFENSKQWLLKAVSFDNENKPIPAFSCYKEGLDKLMGVLKSLPPTETAKRDAIGSRLKEYLVRAEAIKKKLLASGQFSGQGEPKHTQYRIAEGETGYGYARIFGDCLKDASVVWVRVEDPYVRKMYQFHFFLQFCELCQLRCGACLQEVQLVTGPDEADPAKQLECLTAIEASLRDRCGVRLRWRFSDSLHDREVFFSNGWRVKIGRGLSLYQRLPGPLALGSHELALRPCLETTVDIFHESILR